MPVNPAILATAIQPAAASPALRIGVATQAGLLETLRRTLDTRHMWDDDADWLPFATRIDGRGGPSCGGGGCNVPTCGWQFWRIEGLCSLETLESVMFQAARFELARVRLRQLLAQRPTVLTDWFPLSTDSPAPPRVVTQRRAEAAGIRAAARAWAVWCTEVMRAVALARWATNMRWSYVLDANPALARNEGAYLYRAYQHNYDADYRGTATRRSNKPSAEMARGTTGGVVESYNSFALWRGRYEPMREYGGLTWNHVLPSILQLSQHSFGNAWLGRTIRGYNRASQGTQLFGQAQGNAPNHLTDIPNAVVGLTPQGFDPLPNLIFTGDDGTQQRHRVDNMWPWILSSPMPSDPIDFLSLWFGIDPDTATGIKAEYAVGMWEIATREEYYSAGDGFGFGPWTAGAGHRISEPWPHYYPSPYMQIKYCEALAKDILDNPFSAFLAAGFQGWMTAYEALPEAYRTIPPQDMVAFQRQLTQAKLDELFAVYSAATGGITAVVTMVNPIIGAIVGVVLAAVGLLIRFALDLGIVRATNAPCPPPPVIRMILQAGTDPNMPPTPCDYNVQDAPLRRVQDAVAHSVSVFSAGGTVGDYWNTHPGGPSAGAPAGAPSAAKWGAGALGLAAGAGLSWLFI